MNTLPIIFIIAFKSKNKDLYGSFVWESIWVKKGNTFKCFGFGSMETEERGTVPREWGTCAQGVG